MSMAHTGLIFAKIVSSTLKEQFLNFCPTFCNAASLQHKLLLLIQLHNIFQWKSEKSEWGLKSNFGPNLTPTGKRYYQIYWNQLIFNKNELCKVQILLYFCNLKLNVLLYVEIFFWDLVRSCIAILIFFQVLAMKYY